LEGVAERVNITFRDVFKVFFDVEEIKRDIIKNGFTRLSFLAKFIYV